MHINFTSTGLYALENMLTGPARRADRLKPAFEVIATRMMDHEEEVFETAGASVNKPWKVLDDNTIAAKRRAGHTFPERPLSATLRLKKSVTVREHEDMVLEITDTFLRFGTSVPYADYLQKGTRHMEERPFLVFTLANANEYWRIVQKYLFDGTLPVRSGGNG